jgi:hypothetical protein
LRLCVSVLHDRRQIEDCVQQLEAVSRKLFDHHINNKMK